MFKLNEVNWLAVVAAIVIGQVVSTIWFVALFADPWAAEYGAASAAEHTAAIPGYVYGVGLACTTLLTVGIALLHRAVGVETLGQGLSVGAFVAVCFCLATMLPGQAFLDRLVVFLIAGGSQVAMILAISGLLAVWRK